MTTAVQPAGGGGGGVSGGPSPTGLADVIDTILDKGLVLDAYVRVSLVGIGLLTIDARVVVASVDTYLRFAEAVNRLEISDTEQKGLPDLLDDVTRSGAKSKRSSVCNCATSDSRRPSMSAKCGTQKCQESRNAPSVSWVSRSVTSPSSRRASTLYETTLSAASNRPNTTVEIAASRARSVRVTTTAYPSARSQLPARCG